jgi:predicted DNA-binding transcriptional regulator YafY
MLIQRLLKYGDYCEILYPVSMRKKMQSIIQETLNNYNLA